VHQQDASHFFLSVLENTAMQSKFKYVVNFDSDCRDCKYHGKIVEENWLLPIPIRYDATLSDSIVAYQLEERVEDKTCHNTANVPNFYRTISRMDIGECLAIQPVYTGGRRHNTAIDYTPTELYIGNQCLKLMAFICVLGIDNAAHFYTYLRRQSQWWMINDLDVKMAVHDELSQDLCGRRPFLLFYRNIMMSQDDDIDPLLGSDIHWKHIPDNHIEPRRLEEKVSGKNNNPETIVIPDEDRDVVAQSDTNSRSTTASSAETNTISTKLLIPISRPDEVKIKKESPEPELIDVQRLVDESFDISEPQSIANPPNTLISETNTLQFLPSMNDPIKIKNQIVENMSPPSNDNMSDLYQADVLEETQFDDNLYSLVDMASNDEETDESTDDDTGIDDTEMKESQEPTKLSLTDEDIGKIFPTEAQFVASLEDAKSITHVLMRTKHSNKKRKKYVCPEIDCNFEMKASLSTKGMKVTAVQNHTCIRKTNLHSKIKYDSLVDILQKENLFELTPLKAVHLMTQRGIPIQPSKMSKCLKRAKENDPRYSDLGYQYMEALVKFKNGAIQFDNESKFIRCVFVLDAAQLLRFGLPSLVIDATTLRNGEKLFAAISYDAELRRIPVAIGVFPGETIESWHFFLQHIKLKLKTILDEISLKYGGAPGELIILRQASKYH